MFAAIIGHATSRQATPHRDTASCALARTCRQPRLHRFCWSMAQGCLVIVASHVCIEITPLLWSHAALLSIKTLPAFSSLVLHTTPFVVTWPGCNEDGCRLKALHGSALQQLSTLLRLTSGPSKVLPGYLSPALALIQYPNALAAPTTWGEPGSDLRTAGGATPSPPSH